MKFDEILKPSYNPQTITIRFNDEGTNTDAETNIKSTYGRAFPIIRIGNTTFMEGDVKGFHFSVGKTFLPQLSFRVSVPKNRLRENLKTILDNITFYIGNNLDEHFIKLDMLVLDSNAAKNSDSISMECELYLPNLYNKPIRAFSSIKDALKTICSECKMGLLMNYEPPELGDGIQLIQDGISNIEMIQKLASFGSKDFGTVVNAFVDQQMYLCMWEVTKLFEDTSLESIDKNPYSGDSLSAKNNQNKLILSNQFYNDDRPFKIFRYIPTSEYADIAKKLPQNTNIETTKIHTFEIDTREIEHQKELIENQSIQFNLPDEYIDLYKNKLVLERFKNRLQQFVKLEVVPTFLIPQLYCGMNVDVEIFNELSPSWYDDQENPDKSIETIVKEGDANLNVFDLRPNELFSGSYYLASIDWNYASNTRIFQTLALISKMSEDELETHIKA